MTSYVDVFGSDTIPPTENSFAAYSLTGNTTFSWPEYPADANIFYDTVNLNSNGAYALTFPPASEVSVGRSIVLNNKSAFTLTLLGATGLALGTITAGQVRCAYVVDNSSAAGVWDVFSFGTGSSSIDAAAVAGYGLKVISSKLNSNTVTRTAAVTTAQLMSDRAVTMIFTNSGAVSYTLLPAATATDGFFTNISNQGTGAVTIDPNGSELIDGAATKAIAPGESATIVCNGSSWVTVGYGRSTQFQFTKLVLDVSNSSPGVPQTFTLSSTQAENKLMQFIGTETANNAIVVPAVVAVYYLQGAYSGAFTLTIKTAAGTGVVMSNTDRIIVYCDGTNVVLAQTSAAPATSLVGGVAGSIVCQTGIGITGFSAAGAAGQIVLSGGTGVPTFSDLGLLTHAATNKPTPLDADEFSLADSAGSFAPNKLTWASLKATFYAALGTLIAAGTPKTTPVDADVLVIGDSAATNATKTLSWANLKAAALASVGAGIQTQSSTRFTAGGSANAITGTLSPAITSYVAGLRVTTKPAAANTSGAATLELNGLGTKTIRRRDFAGGKAVILPGDYNTSGPFDFEYDGTDFIILNPVSTPPQVQRMQASVAANALTFTLVGNTLEFRSATLSSATVSVRNFASQVLVVPSGATLGTLNAIQARLVLLAIDNAGTVEPAVVNLAGGNNLDETTLISTTAISAAASAANVFYSTNARSNVPFRVVGFVDITEATAGTWATAPSTIQGEGGQALSALSSFGYGQTWQNVAGSRVAGTTYYNTTGRPIQLSISSNSVASNITVGGIVVGIGNSLAGNYQTPIVPPGASYLLQSGATIIAWLELR